jgi:hypothetical protein
VGVCPSCHITAFLQDPHFPFAGLLRARPIAETLRWPALQQQMARIVAAADADIPASQIDWERVIAQWDLPRPICLPRVKHIPVLQVRIRSGLGDTRLCDRAYLHTIICHLMHDVVLEDRAIHQRVSNKLTT